MPNSGDFTLRVHRLVRRIPYGRVLSYGDVAALIGAPRSARGVGQVLRSLPDGSDLPWWRVINGRGELSLTGFPGAMQRMMLEQEGVQLRSGRVEMQRYRWISDRDGGRAEASDCET